MITNFDYYIFPFHRSWSPCQRHLNVLFMDIGLLRAFIEIHRLRHFGRAARNLFISQSAISARIRLLEEEVGTRLFTRDRNNIELTPAGSRFLVYAENILNTWQRARQELAMPEGTSTFLSVAALPSLWDIFLEDWLSWLYESDANIALQADVMPSDTLNRRLLAGELDLGFMFDPPKSSQLMCTEVSEIPLIMVSSEEKISAQEAVRENYVLVDWGTSFTVKHAQIFPELPPPRLRASVGRIALGLLNHCGGCAYLPEAMVKTQLGETLYRVKDAPVIKKKAYAVYASDNSKLENIQQILGWF